MLARWTKLLFEESNDFRLNIALCMLVLIFGVATRYIYIESISHSAYFIADAEKYFNLVINIVENGVYSHRAVGAQQHDTFITPGYPLFLAAVMSFSGTKAEFFHYIVSIQAALSALTVMLTYLIGRSFLPVWGSLLASFLVGISPQLIVASGYLLTETLFTFCLILSVYVLIQAVRRKSVYLFFLFGLIAGYASLVRPALILYPFFVAILFWVFNAQVGKSSRWLVSVICAGVLIVWAPWAVWKNVTPNITTSSPSALVSSFALGTYPDLTYKTRAYRGYPYLEDPSYREMQKSFGATLQIAGNRANHEPLTYLAWYLFGKPIAYWGWGTIVGAGGPYIYPVNYSIYNKSKVAVNTLLFSETSHPLWLVSALGVILFLLQHVVRTPRIDAEELPLMLLALLLIYFTALHSVLAPLPRYSFPIIPELYLVAIYGIWRTGASYKRLSEKLYSRMNIYRIR